MMKRVMLSILIAAQVLVGLAEILVADPSIYCEGGTYYLVGTDDGKTSPVVGQALSGLTVFPLYVSKDFRSWQMADTPAGEGRLMLKADAFGKANFWAPQLFRHKDRYCFAYTADFHWGIAVSDSPRGPFKPHAEFPRQKWQSIDPFILHDDDGRVYAYYSCCNVGGTTCVELSSDLKSIIGRPVRCVCNDQPWEHLKLEKRYEALNEKFHYSKDECFKWGVGVTEGPSVIKRKGKYVLFYSANDFRSPDYCVGAAVADAPKGPWRKLQTGPVLWREHTGLNGTGHGDVFTTPNGELWYVFHAHNSGIRVSPRRTGIIRLRETWREDGYPRYEAEPATMKLL